MLSRQAIEAFLRPWIAWALRNWKPIAGVALPLLISAGTYFDMLTPGQASTIVAVAAAVGITLHHKGDPLPPIETPPVSRPLPEPFVALHDAPLSNKASQPSAGESSPGRFPRLHEESGG